MLPSIVMFQMDAAHVQAEARAEMTSDRLTDRVYLSDGGDDWMRKDGV